MRKAKTWLIISISYVLAFAAAGAGEARNYQTWCKSFSTGENLACSTLTDHGGTYSYTPGVAPTIYSVPDNTLFNVQYEAAGHEKALFSMFVDSKVSSCVKGADCNFSNGEWDTQCVWNKVDGWVCTIYHQGARIKGAKINQYYLWTDYAVTNYIYLAPTGNKIIAPIITAVPAISYPENTGPLPNIVDLWFYTGDDKTPKQDLTYAIASQTNPGVVSCSPENTGSLSNIVDLWFYTGDDKTPKQDLTYAIASQTNPGVVSCSITSNRYIDCLTQPSANGFSDITFTAKDSSGAATSSTFRITITPANPAPPPTDAGARITVPLTPEGDTTPPENPSETQE